jgi:hypothetical protein
MYYSIFQQDHLQELFISQQWHIIRIYFKVVNDEKENLEKNKRRYNKEEYRGRLRELCEQILLFRSLAIEYELI